MLTSADGDRTAGGGFFLITFIFLPYKSDERTALESTSAFRTAKMTSHFRRADDAADYFTFSNFVSAVSCKGSFKGHGQKTLTQKVKPCERARARPEKF